MENKEENVIAEEELQVYDVDAKEMTFGDETENVSEQGDVVEEEIEATVAPTTHGEEEALPGTLEEE